MTKIIMGILLGLVVAAAAFIFFRARIQAPKPVDVAAAAEPGAIADSSDDNRYYVDMEGIDRIMPPGVAMPPKLAAFLKWVGTQPNGSVGHMEFGGNRFDDHWIENGSKLATQFVQFIRLGDGTTIGYWLYKGRTLDTAPIVLLGSEGELEILAHGLPEFLAGLVNNNHDGNADLTADRDEDDDDKTANRRAELGEFLASAFKFTVDENTDYAKAAQGKHPDLKKWMDDWAATQTKISNADPTRRAIATATKPRWANLKETWDSVSLDLFVAADKVQQQMHRNTTEPMAELEQIAPLVLALRKTDLEANPERGAFHFLSLRIHRNGHVMLMRQDHFQELGGATAKIPEGAAPDILADAKKYPRVAYWTPHWLAGVLNAGK
jgi:hypothetical protein